MKYILIITATLLTNLTFGQSKLEKDTINSNPNDKEGELRINDFLKSLFGLPKFNEPAQWLLQGNSKYLRSVLEGMQTKGDITIKDNRHRMLGQSHYEPITGKQLHHTLNTVDIVVKK